MSGLDVLVEFYKVPGMLRFLDLKRDLATTLSVRVDQVQKEAHIPPLASEYWKKFCTYERAPIDPGIFAGYPRSQEPDRRLCHFNFFLHA